MFSIGLMRAADRGGDEPLLIANRFATHHGTALRAKRWPQRLYLGSLDSRLLQSRLLDPRRRRRWWRRRVRADDARLASPAGDDALRLIGIRHLFARATLAGARIILTANEIRPARRAIDERFARLVYALESAIASHGIPNASKAFHPCSACTV